MTAETDLDRLLATLEPALRPGEFVFTTSATGTTPPDLRTHATVQEAEGTTAVVRRADADAHRLPYEHVLGWITLEVRSSLASVGLTATVSAALAAEGISCNVLAGYHHDHLLVPIGRVADALAVLEALSERSTHDAGRTDP